MSEFLKNIDTKKIIYIIVIVIIIIAIIIGFSIIGNSMFSKSSYSEIEKIMETTAIKYYEDNNSKLPQTIGGTAEIDVEDLIKDKYMKEISKYTKNDKISCDGKVNVTNVNNSYRYVPMLDCGDEYKTISLSEFIKNNEEIVENGDGLYSIDEKLVYRGEKLNNYASFNSKTYRIIKIENDSVVLIYDEKLSSTNWDDRYNSDKKSSIGINDYGVSRISEYLDSLYNDTTVFNLKNKMLLSSYNLLVGKKAASDTDKNNTAESTNVIGNKYVGLITVSDFLMASLDNNCKSTTSPACINYNYLANWDYSYWTITAESENSYKVYKIDPTTGISAYNANSRAYVRPVIYLVKDAIYVDGDGSIENPYTFK